MFCTSETVVLELQHVLDALFGNTLFPRSLGILAASYLIHSSSVPPRVVCAHGRARVARIFAGAAQPTCHRSPGGLQPRLCRWRLQAAPGGAVSGLTGTGCGCPSWNGRQGLYGARVASGERGVGATIGALVRCADFWQLGRMCGCAQLVARRSPRALAASARAGTPATRARATMRRAAPRMRRYNGE